MFVNTGPCNAVIANVVTPNMRATAFAIATLRRCTCSATSGPPSLMGWVADLCGKPDTMATGFGRFLRPDRRHAARRRDRRAASRTSCAGMLIMVPAVFLGGVVFLAGAATCPARWP